MDAAFDLQAMTQQGPVFWLASGAVALGLSMIVAALVQAHRMRRPATRPETALPPQTTEHQDRPLPAPEPVSAEAPVPAAVSTWSPDSSSTHRLERLLGRLDRVSALLEGTEIPATEPTPSGESDLKETASGVEYVFRATGG